MLLKTNGSSSNLGSTLLWLYGMLGKNAPGRWLFSRIVGWMAPYSGSIRATVADLQPRYAVVRMADRRRVSNHLNSVHAMALANLGEMTTGLALVAALPDGTRAILVDYSIHYVKKARGTISASAITNEELVPRQEPYLVRCHIRNKNEELVAKVEAHWLVSRVA